MGYRQSLNLLRILTVLLLVLTTAYCCQAMPFRKYDCKYYQFYADIDPFYANALARHVEAIHDTLSPFQRTSNIPKGARVSAGTTIINRSTGTSDVPTAIYVMDKRSDFISFCITRKNTVPSAGTVGIFGPDNSTGGYSIATYTEGDPYLTRTMENLQHECAHQFWQQLQLISGNFPGWVSEGGPEFFRFMYYNTGGRLFTGVIPLTESSDVIQAVKSNSYFKFPQFLSAPISAVPSGSTVFYYHQAWSFFHFLYVGQQGKYHDQLITYINALRNNPDPLQLFGQVFKCAYPYQQIEQEWKQYVLNMTPDVTPYDLLQVSDNHKTDTDRTQRDITVSPIGWAGLKDAPQMKCTLYFQNGIQHPGTILYTPRYIVRLNWMLIDGREAWSASYEVNRTPLTTTAR